MLWQASIIEDGVILSLVSEDGEENYPGEVTANVTYRLTDDSELVIRFQATTKKKPTPINLTSHPYFNLAGEVRPLVCYRLLLAELSLCLDKKKSSLLR